MQAKEEFPLLGDYQDLWPAWDFAKMYLKNKTAGNKVKGTR